MAADHELSLEDPIEIRPEDIVENSVALDPKVETVMPLREVAVRNRQRCRALVVVILSKGQSANPDAKNDNEAIAETTEAIVDAMG